MKSYIPLAKLEKKVLDLANAFATWLVSLKLCDNLTVPACSIMCLF